jgi:hypothetical protein
MNYGEVATRITLIKCDWVRHDVDDNGEPTYKRDTSGFLLAHFSYMVKHPYDSFVLST